MVRACGECSHRDMRRTTGVGELDFWGPESLSISMGNHMGFPTWLSAKESTCQCRRQRRFVFNLWVRKIPWKRKWQLTPVFLPGKFHGQRSLVGYSPFCCKELDTTERLHFHFSLSCIGAGNASDTRELQLLKEALAKKETYASFQRCIFQGNGFSMKALK